MERRWSTFAVTKTRWVICEYDHVPGPELSNMRLPLRPALQQAHWGSLRGRCVPWDPQSGAARGFGGAGGDGGHGHPFLFCNDLDFDVDGNLYFTDTSMKYQCRQFFLKVGAGHKGPVSQVRPHQQAYDGADPGAAISEWRGGETLNRSTDTSILRTNGSGCCATGSREPLPTL